MSAGLRIRILNFETRYKIPVGFEVVPAPVPAGTNPDPSPRPTGSVSADLRVFCTRCHLECPPPVSALCPRLAEVLRRLPVPGGLGFLSGRLDSGSAVETEGLRVRGLAAWLSQASFTCDEQLKKLL